MIVLAGPRALVVPAVRVLPLRTFASTPLRWDKQPRDEPQLQQRLQPYWDRLQQQYALTKQQVHSFVTPLRFHLNKARDAIRQANDRLNQQELESKNYDFNQDLTNGDGHIRDLPSERERHRKKWKRKLELYIDSLQETIFTATRALNDVTGYSSIQKLRQSIEVLEKDLERSKERVRVSKDAYSDAISRRLEVQKQVNELLSRKSTWTPTDLENFTKLYKEDQDSALAEDQAKKQLEHDDLAEEELQNKLTKAILTRYHEEQIWSDKIRRTSTWGTFGLMGINILLFLVFQLALEPWKRRRLVGNFEEKVAEVLRENSTKQNEVFEVMNRKIQELNKTEGLLDSDGEYFVSSSDDIIEDPIEPPVVTPLPLPFKPLTFRQRIRVLVNSIRDLLAPSINLLTNSELTTAILTKNELISISTCVLLIGVSMGSLITSLF